VQEIVFQERVLWVMVPCDLDSVDVRLETVIVGPDNVRDALGMLMVWVRELTVGVGLCQVRVRLTVVRLALGETEADNDPGVNVLLIDSDRRNDSVLLSVQLPVPDLDERGLREIVRVASDRVVVGEKLKVKVCVLWVKVAPDWTAVIEAVGLRD